MSLPSTYYKHKCIKLYVVGEGYHFELPFHQAEDLCEELFSCHGFCSTPAACHAS